MSNRAVREPQLNDITSLVPLSALTDTGVTGTGLDLTNTNAPNHIVVVSISALTDIARVFVTIQESFEGGSSWTTLTSFAAITVAGLHRKTIKRTKRYLRAVITTEPPASPTTPAFSVAVLLLS